jgi:hypothetical protein
MAKHPRRKATTLQDPARPSRETQTGDFQASSPSPGKSTPKPSQTAPDDAGARNVLVRLLRDSERLASAFHADFLKCQRQRDRLRPRVRSRVSNLVDTYAKKVARLRQRFATLPHDAIVDIPGLGGLQSVAGTVRSSLDRMHQGLEEQQAAIAAPMDEQEQREFWRGIRKLALEMRSLESFVKGVREWIELEKKGSEDPRLTKIELAFTQLCEAITGFFRSYSNSKSTASPTSIQRVQAAVTRYRAQLGDVRRVISKDLPEPAGPTPPARRFGDPIAEGTQSDELKAALGCQALLIDALCLQDALRYGLPLSAERQALEIKEVVNPALRDNHLLVATIEVHAGDAEAEPDIGDEEILPDYPKLSANATESNKFRLLVDSGLLLHQSRGPDATFDRRELQKSVTQLATSRGITAVGATTVWATLNKLVDLQIFRKFPAKKTRANPNASDEYRLTFPAQSKYSTHTSAVQAELSPHPSPAAAARET